MGAPQGTVAFLFSDIEGSTRLWERSSSLASQAIQQHDALMYRAFSENGTVFKTVGDAFCVAFPTVGEALAAALNANRSIGEAHWPNGQPLQVRFAIHAGSAEFRDGDYFGTTLNRVARLLSTGHGGQILLSEVAYGLLRDGPIEGFAIKSLGEHRLKDLGRPESVYQASLSGSRDTFPALRSLDSFANNLPSQLTSFIGRDDELTVVGEATGRDRLVTIVGSGGCGKTRLALQVAANSLESFADGCWFVELAMCSDDSKVVLSIASALGIQESMGAGLEDSLINHLSRLKMLLVIDNCEHVLAGVSPIVARILSSCPGVHVLATSREALSIAGERSFRIRSLSLPEKGTAQSIQSLTQFESVRLFIDRVLSCRSDFEVTRENAPAIAELCWRLDGIPLAIELAAARLRSMTVEDVLHRLDDRFRLLVSGAKAGLARHQTLRAMIDWSYDLLVPSEQVLLQRLSVFAGPWSLASCEEICAQAPLDPRDLIFLLSSLVEKNLVVFDEGRSPANYQLLESIRQYAAGRLRESGEQGELRRLHFEWFVELVRNQEAEFNGPNDIAALEVIANSYSDILSAIDWGLADPVRLDGLVVLCDLLGRFWEGRYLCRQGIEVCDRVLDLATTVEGSYVAPVQCNCGRLLLRVGEYDRAMVLLQQAIPQAAANADARILAWSKLAMGGCIALKGEREAALPILHEAFDFSVENGLMPCTISSANGLGLTYSALGRSQEAIHYLELALKLTRDHGSDYRRASTLVNLGVAYRDADRLDDARVAHLEGLEICQKDGIPGVGTYHLANLGGLMWMLGRPDEALEFARCAIEILSQAQDTHRVHACLLDVIAVEIMRGNFARAAILLGGSEAMAAKAGIDLDVPDQARYLPEFEKAKTALGSERYAKLSLEGAAWPWTKLVSYALEPTPNDGITPS